MGCSCRCGLGRGLPVPRGLAGAHVGGGRALGSGQGRRAAPARVPSCIPLLPAAWQEVVLLLFYFFFFFICAQVILKYYFTVINDWQGTVFGFRSRFELRRVLGDIWTYISDLCHLLFFFICLVCQATKK